MDNYKSKSENQDAQNKGSTNKGRNRKTNKSGFKKYSKNNSRDKESKEFSKLKESANDPSWYYYSDQSLKDAGRYSFNNALGVALPLGTGYFNVPGIMNIYTVPTIGISTNNVSAVNLAAKNLYSFVRHANSGHANYDSPDLMMYILAMDSLYSMYAWMTRVYGLAKVYIQQNRYYGARFLESMGVDANDIIKNLSNFRTYINQFAIKLSAFYVPATMSLFKRHMWMYSNVFADEDDPKASCYMYQPAYLFKYDEVNGRLVTQDVVGSFSSASGVGYKLPNTMGYNAIILIAEAMLQEVVASESMNIMSGDILKAYGSENCWKFTAIADDYAILPMFSEEVLVQIHNTKFVGSYPVANTGDAASNLSCLQVYQNTTPGYGAILYGPIFRGMALGDLQQIFDTWHREVSPEEVMVGSRNMVAGQVLTLQSSDQKYYPYHIVGTAGSELCLFATIWTLDQSGNFTSSVHYNTSQAYGTEDAARDAIAKESRFNEAPLSTTWVYVNPGTGEKIIRARWISGEISNYVLMDIEDIMKLHDTALLSEFAVPFLGNAIKS